ncbi:MAG: hypothetical protein JSS27_08560 [Planctomycetes bacterium]|nr:hypothetical protein [Planctomycetota bacterium]
MNTVSIDEAISLLRSEPEFREVGVTASRGTRQYYELAKDCRFKRCDCTYHDDYGWHEFVSTTETVGERYVVALNLKLGKITVGPKGYHSEYVSNPAHKRPLCV